jgi:ankyrin repeat protein
MKKHLLSLLLIAPLAALAAGEPAASSGSAGAESAAASEPAEGGAGYTMTDKEMEEMALNLERFRTAILNGQLSKVKELIEKGVSPNTVMPNGDTPLTYALRSDSFDVADYLIDSGAADVKLENGLGETPVMLAVYKNRPDEFEKMIKLGATVRKDRGWTALHYAAAGSSEKLLERVIALGADVNAQTSAGVTPLMMAARRPSAPAVQALLKAGARKDLCTDAGLSAAYFAAKAGEDSLTKLLAVDTCAVRGPLHPELYGKQKGTAAQILGK